ncbi:MAG: phosphotransferase [Acidobacteria bacterium]|nr:phosphotransferase [Acidobacteriota bacterium]
MAENQIPLRRALDELLGRIEPGARVTGVRRMGEDETDVGEGTAKGIGYGVSLLVEIAGSDGKPQRMVFRTNRAGQFGHDRRSDRAADALLAFDTTAGFPSHAAVVDVGAIQNNGRLESLADTGEMYFLTEYFEGAPYADDLRRIGEGGGLTELDRQRCVALARYLARLHAQKIHNVQAYQRAVRDLIGHGEGLFGLADSFREDAPGVPLERLRRIESLAVDWRWRLRGRETRLCRTHGDFHPFNILFHEGAEPLLLDASRGCQGDPADDVTCLSINYLFFALEHPAACLDFRELWRLFWRVYLAETVDNDLFESAPPYWAWRVLVLANPLWYPMAKEGTRRKLLGAAEDALHNGRLDPVRIEELFCRKV